MTLDGNSLFDLVQLMREKAPEYVKLVTAQSEAEFDVAFDAMLERAISSLEQNSKNFQSLDEVGLSGCLALALSMPGLSVTQEAHSNGHVDITIDMDHCCPIRRKLGEAKIYNGPEYHVQGLGQLLKRYTTGREGRGILIVYVRKQNISGLMNKIREKMDAEHPCQQQGDTVDHAFKWSFLSRHAHSCGDVLDVSHVGCNLYNDPSP
jgi:hypothetical protein